MGYLLRFAFTACFLLLLLGCAVPGVEKRKAQALDLVEVNNWNQITYQTKRFDIIGFIPSADLARRQHLAVYIEGDGLAWLSRSRISPDPTPINPVALKLALRHPDRSVVYLARPCQYGAKRNCSKELWTSARFSPEVVDAYRQVLDQLKGIYAVQQFELVGFSGGGALALLVAAQRSDVVGIVTVAGNLNHQKWTEMHGVSPLIGSMNPIDYREQISAIKQLHLVGGQDQIMPPAIAHSYVDDLIPEAPCEIKIIEMAGHGDSWDLLWPQIYQQN